MAFAPLNPGLSWSQRAGIGGMLIVSVAFVCGGFISEAREARRLIESVLRVQGGGTLTHRQPN